MQYLCSDSPEYDRKCAKVAELAKERTIRESQRYGANLQVGSEDWRELYSDKWGKAYDEVFEGITVIPAV